MASLVNDIFSFHKDFVVEGSDFNLINILMELGDVSFETAVEESLELVNGYADSFAKVRAQLPPWDEGVRATVEPYLDGLEEMMSGNVYWHGTTNRYRSPESPFAELRQLI